MSVGGTLRTPLVGGGGIAVAQPVHSILENAVVLVGWTLKLDAYYDNRLAVDLAAEADKLIGAEAVLVIIHPHPVCPALTLLLRANAPFPVVLRHVTATRPAQAGGVQLLHGLQDIRTESAQILTCLRGHRYHIDLYCTVLRHDDEVAVAAKLRNLLDGLYAQVIGEFYKVTGWLDTIRADSAMTIDTFDHLGIERKFIFLPLLAHLKRLAGDNIAFRTAQSDNQFALTFCIDGAYIVLAINVQRTLENAGLGLASRNLLRIAHVDSIVFDETVFATFAESRPLLGDSWNLHIARHALKHSLAVSGRQLDVAIGGLGIVHPERHEIAVGTLQTVVGQHLLVVPIDRYLAAATLDTQFVPFLLLVDLFLCGRSRSQRHQRVHATGASAEALCLAHFHLTDREVGRRALLLQPCTCSSLVGSVNLRLRLCWRKRAALIIRVVYAYIIRCAVGLVADGETDVHQTATPTASSQLVGTPVHVHRQVKVAGVDTVNLEWLLVAGRGVEHHVIVHIPAVEVTVAWWNARILFRLERTFLNQFLPHTVVGTEIDMLEELSVEHLVDDA